MMFDLFESIQSREFTPINFLSTSEWKLLGKRPDSNLKFSCEEVIDVEDKDDIQYIYKYLVAKSTKIRV